jgi:hypothetical protein
MFRHLGRPSPALLVAFVALLVALGGTAYAATTIVNIADPATPANKAKVDATGKLAVGDGTGPLTVDGTTTAQAAPASAFYHRGGAVFGGGVCSPIATPPAGKALIVRDVRVNVFQDPSPGTSQYVAFVVGPADTNCSGGGAGEINPPTIGQTVMPFDPGLGVPAGYALSAVASGSVNAQTWVDGFVVPPSSVPSTGISRPSGILSRR